MAWGLEARVPFLDHEVVEFAASIPPELKLRGVGKYILKEAARRVIPEVVIDRPNVKDALNSKAAASRNIFRKDYINKLFKDPVAHTTPLKRSKL
jgi:asparagine synthase (glutamine-hydrolysing)